MCVAKETLQCIGCKEYLIVPINACDKVMMVDDDYRGDKEALINLTALEKECYRNLVNTMGGKTVYIEQFCEGQLDACTDCISKFSSDRSPIVLNYTTSK